MTLALPSQLPQDGYFNGLVDELIETRHRPLRRTLDEIAARLASVTDRYGVTHPELPPLLMLFNDFADALRRHLTREERGLYRLTRGLDGAPRTNSRPPQCESLSLALRSTLAEHDAVIAELDAMKRLSGDFTPPAGVGDDFRDVYHLLAKLARQYRAYVHREAASLRPALEERLRAAAV
jgi:regulator of cell morphogenesis and NO signaling